YSVGIETDSPTCLPCMRKRTMRRTFLLAGLLLALASVLPTRADDKKPTDKKPDPKPADQLVNKTDLNGKLVHVEGPGKGIRVQTRVPTPAPGVKQNIANWQRERAIPRAPGRAQELRNATAQNQGKMYTPPPFDVDIEPGDDVKVAAKTPPVAFDD